jgi:hypothetical protein
MINLYIHNKTEKLQSLNRKLRDYIEIAYIISSKNFLLQDLHANNESASSEKFQNYLEIDEKGFQYKIDQHTNLQAYAYHSDENDQTFVKNINNLYFLHSTYMDSTEKDFTSTFSDNYQKKIFELICAELMARNFKLIHNPSGSDIGFENRSKSYLLECTTRNSSLMDVYVNTLADFDRNLKVARIFQRCHKKLADSREYGWGGSWCIYVEQLWYELNSKERQKIINLFSAEINPELLCNTSLQSVLPKWLSKKLNKWVDLNQYAWFYFRNILPPILARKMKTILPSCKSDDMPEIAKFLIKSIVAMTMRKLDRKFFEKKMPVVLALSLATLPDFMSISPAFNNFEGMAKSIAIEFRENAKFYLKDGQDLKIFRENLKFLYAIIIDTTWYNWFPKIVEDKHQVKWPDERKNCYIAIYNNNLSENLNCDPHIFSLFINNEIDLPLNIDCAETVT